MNIGIAVQTIMDTIAPDALTIKTSRSGSHYITCTIDHGAAGIELNFRVSDHPLPIKFIGDADLFGSDEDGAAKIKAIWEPIEKQLYPPTPPHRGGFPKVTYFRIDEWYKNGSGGKFYFAQTETEALAHVFGMERISIADTENQEHTSIMAFKARTCDREGWEEAVKNSETATPEYFK